MPKRRRSANCLILLRLAVAAFVACGLQAADVIFQLRNGDRLTGAVISETPTEITIKSKALGKITIPAAEVEKRETVVVKPTAPATNAVAAVTTPAPSATNQTSNATNKPPATIAAKPAPPAAAPKPQEPKHWNTEIQLGMNLRYTTRDQQEALVVAKSTYAKNRFREILDYNFTWGRTEDLQTANRMAGSTKSEYDINPKWYAFNVGAGGYDEIRKIDREFELDPGIGYNIVKKPKLVLKGEVGFGYHDQFFADGHELATYSGRLAGIFTWRIYDKLMADGRMEYFPNVKAIDQYRLRFESTLRYPLLKNVSLNLIVIDLYDTEAPAGVENNDLQVRTAIGMKF
jgi:hypothetical protein